MENGFEDQMLMIIDTDPGVDDAQAIFMALKYPNVRVLAITTCDGNSAVQQVTINTLRVLKAANRLDVSINV